MLLEPARSCYGFSLYWYLGLVEYSYGWIRFRWNSKTYGINFLFFLGSCVIRKLVHSSWWELEIRLCGLEVGWAEFIGHTVSFWCMCVRVCVCSKIFVTLIFHDHFHCCEIFLSRFLISFVFKQPLHLVFNKAATIVLNRISSFHIVWFSHINICVVTKQMRDKNTRIVNKWPVTKVTHQPKKWTRIG